MGPKTKKESASSVGRICVENSASPAIAGAETEGSTNHGHGTTLSNSKKKTNRDRRRKRGESHHQQANHHHQYTSRSTTNVPHHPPRPNSRKRSLRQLQQSSSSSSTTTVKIDNNNNVQHDDIEEQLKRQRQKQAEKEKLQAIDTARADTPTADAAGVGGGDAASTLPVNLGMYRYDAKRQSYFPASYLLTLDDIEDPGEMSSSLRHHRHDPSETCTSSTVVARCRTFPHSPLPLDKKPTMPLSSPLLCSSSPSSCSFAYPVASCGHLSQRLGLVSTWAGRSVLESFGWTPSAAFLPSANRASQACAWQFLHGCATTRSNSHQMSSSNNSFIVRPVDIGCKIGTVSWTRTFDVQWTGSDAIRQPPPRVVTVTDLDYVVQQHGRPRGKHLDFRRHCLGASVHSPRFLDNPHPDNSMSTPSSRLGTLDSAHGRSSLRLHKLFDDDDDDDDSNHADVVFNFSSTQNDFVYCANESLVFAPVMHHHAVNTNQQSSNVNVNSITCNGYAPWLLCIEHGSFHAMRSKVNSSESVFPRSEALCVEADPANPNCFYFGHRNGQVTLFDINSGSGQSTVQASSPSSSADTMTTSTTNRSSVPYFGSITSIHPMSSSSSTRQVLVRGSQGSCRLYDFRKLGSTSMNGAKGKRHAHSHGDPSLVYEMTPLPLRDDDSIHCDDYACGNDNLSPGHDVDGGSSHIRRRERRRHVQRLTSRCNGVVTNPEETIVISPHVQVLGADQEEMPTLGFWSLHTGDWIGSKALAPSLTTGSENEQREIFPATTQWGVSWIELSKRITPAWQWRKPKFDDKDDKHIDEEDDSERSRENEASNLRPRPGAFGIWYKCGQSMAGPGLPPSAGSIHHVYATGNPFH